MGGPPRWSDTSELHWDKKANENNRDLGFTSEETLAKKNKFIILKNCLPQAFFCYNWSHESVNGICSDKEIKTSAN